MSFWWNSWGLLLRVLGRADNENKGVILENEKLIGKEFETSHGGICKIISLTNRKNILVRFYNGYETVCNYPNLLKGIVANPLHPKLYGVGFFGVGDYSAKINAEIHPYYDAWRGALRRSYDEKWHVKCPNYIGCQVDSRWHNYQHFCKWVETQVFFKGYKLDKDLLVKDNKIYGPDTCVFLPNELNCIIASHHTKREGVPNGVYMIRNPKFRNKPWVANMSRRGEEGTPDFKCIGYFATPEEASIAYVSEKERYVRERANFWRDRISLKAYEALLKWKAP